MQSLERLNLNQLNDEQREATTYGAGPLLIVAGPGTGKTRVITHRIAWLVREQGVYPSTILAVTFTNRAAREMRNRLERLIGVSEAKRLWMGTFHGLCAKMLRRHGQFVGIPNRYVIYDVDDQERVIRNAAQNLRIDVRAYTPRMLRNEISKEKTHGRTLEQFRANCESPFDETVARVWERYQEELHAAAALDFDDLLIFGVALLGIRAVQSRYQERLRHVLVDEFQDVNDTQYELAKAWSSVHKNLVVVGDPDQAIYSWRGADPSNMRRFLDDHRDAAVIELTANYRSTQQILDVANHLMAPIDDLAQRELRALNPDGSKPHRSETESEVGEANSIAESIRSDENPDGHPPGDVAVLYRTNAQSRPLEEALIRFNVPYRLVNATKFYDRREIRDLLAYLRLLGNPDDQLSFLRAVATPRRGVGEKTLLKLTEWAALHDRTLVGAARFASGQEQSSVSPPIVQRRAAKGLGRFLKTIDQARMIQTKRPLVDALRFIVEEIKFEAHIRQHADDEQDAEDRWQNIQELVTVAARYSELPPGTALSQFLEDVALVSDGDELPDGRRNVVTLSTMHQAKGLEFPVVFIAGCDDVLIPSSRSHHNEAELAEERRLLYVGVTRAERELNLLHADMRSYQGVVRVMELSRFLSDMPDDLFQITRLQREKKRQSLPAWPRSEDSRNQFAAGDRVNHPLFGEGVVLGVSRAEGNTTVGIQFERVGVREINPEIVPLARC